MSNPTGERSFDKATLAALGIEHSKVDQYVVDGYRYSPVQDAVHQARRSRG